VLDRLKGLDAGAYLPDNDSTGFFEPPWTTCTNINDCRIILVD